VSGSGAGDQEAVLRAFLNETDSDPDVLAVWFYVYRAHRALMGAMDERLLKPFGLSFRGYVLLMTCWMRGPLGVAELAQAQGVTRAAIVQAANTLEKRELIVRAPDAADGRKVQISLTDAGLRLVEQAHARIHDFERAATSGLSAGEMQTLTSLLRRVVEAA